MRIRILSLLLTVLLCLSACGAQQTVSPAPSDMLSAMAEADLLSGVTEVSAEYLAEELGLDPAGIAEAVYCIPDVLTSPEEIILIRSVSEEDAGEAFSALETRLDYKQKSARLYMTEYAAVLDAGFVRRDGLTVSLVVSAQSAEISALLDSLG